MDLNTFAENFALLADTPNGPPKLRELILQLAVRGKLVAQNPHDEPASVLIKRIAAERQELISQGKIRKAKPPPLIRRDEMPYQLPDGWEWVLMHNISINIHYGYTASADASHRAVRLLRITDIQNDKVNWDTVPGCKINERLVADYALSDGDIVVARTGGTIGKSYLISDLDIGAVFASYLIRIIPSKDLSPEYLKLFLGSELYWNQLYEKSMGTGQPNVNGTSLKCLRVPLPPFAEQKRIVARVHQLMALCDKLEERQKKRDEVRVSMNAACLHELTSPEIKKSQRGWTRVRNHFNLLYDTPKNVAALRQSILQLAVMGKLVRQNRKEEPASVLIKKIAAEKERLIAEGKIKKSKPVPPIAPDEVPYELPQGWTWVRLNQLCSLITKGSSPKWQGVQYVDEGAGVLFITSENVGRMTMLMVKKKYVEKKFNKIEPRSVLRKKDVLMNIVGASIGRTALFDLDKVANINQAVCLIRCIEPDVLLKLRYLLLFLNSETCIGYMFTKQVDMARANLSMGNIAKFPIPLPPLAEQERIMTRIDQLMALCDELESKLQQSQSEGEKLITAVVNQIAMGEDEVALQFPRT